jgi:uncharacterized protein YjeT (DUF2065 family)
MWQYFLLGLALMLVFEGILPFIMPERYKQFLRKMAEQSDRNLRTVGLVLMVIGVAILFILKQSLGI